jgi:hypothetical protein
MRNAEWGRCWMMGAGSAVGSGQWAVGSEDGTPYWLLSTCLERLFYLFELENVGGDVGFENPSPSPSLRGRGTYGLAG